MSISSNLSPLLHALSVLSKQVKPLPSRLTVSIPMCSSMDKPLSVRNPIACFVSNTKMTCPSSGATMVAAAVGVTTAPSPIILPANASSGAVARSAAIPVIGLDTIMVSFTTSFASCVSAAVLCRYGICSIRSCFVCMKLLVRGFLQIILKI